MRIAWVHLLTFVLAVVASLGCAGPELTPVSTYHVLSLCQENSVETAVGTYLNSTGDEPVVLEKGFLTGPDVADFRLSSFPPGTTIAPGSRFYYDVAFNATDPGKKRATLNIVSNDPDTTTVIELYGYRGCVFLHVNTLDLRLPDQAVASGVSTGVLILTNSGTAAAEFTGDKISLEAHSAFSFTSPPDTSPLDPGATRPIYISFDPDRVGYLSTSLKVTYNEEPIQRDITVYMTGLGLGSVASPNLPRLSFGQKVITEPQTRWRRGTIRNYGNRDLVFTGDGLALAGVNKDDFVLSSTITAGTVLKQYEWRELEIAFKPGSVGDKEASLVVTTNDPVNSVLSYTLTGTGLAPRDAVAEGPYTGHGPGHSTIGAGGDYESLFAACEDVGRYPLTGGDWNFSIISDLDETTNSKLGQFDTNGNHLIFRPADGVSPVVTFSPTTPGYSNGNLTIGTSNTSLGIYAGPALLSTHNIIIDGSPASDATTRTLTFRSDKMPQTGSMFYVIGDCDGIEFRNLWLHTNSNSYYSRYYQAAIMFESYYAAESRVIGKVVVDNCDFLCDGFYPHAAITCYGDLTRLLRNAWVRNIAITGNRIKTSYSGVGPISAAKALITSNTIELAPETPANSQAPAVCGIALFHNYGGSSEPVRGIISGNHVDFHTSSTQLAVSTGGIAYMSNAMGAQCDIVNNMISGISKHMGISVTSNVLPNYPPPVDPLPMGTANVFHNSIYFKAAGMTTIAPRAAIGTDNVFFGSLSYTHFQPANRFFGHLNVKNNLIRMEEPGGSALLCVEALDGWISDHNMISVGTSTTLAQVGDQLYQTLADWQTSQSMDLHSATQNPFEAAGAGLGAWAAADTESLDGADGAPDLHFTSYPGPAYIGAPAGVAWDIDGQPRSPSAPIMGADEVHEDITQVEDWRLY